MEESQQPIGSVTLHRNDRVNGKEVRIDGFADLRILARIVTLKDLYRLRSVHFKRLQSAGRMETRYMAVSVACLSFSSFQTFGVVISFSHIAGLPRGMCCATNEEMAGVFSPGHLDMMNSGLFQVDGVQEGPGGNMFASATETVTQGKSRLNRFDGVHHPRECRVRVHSRPHRLLLCQRCGRRGR